MELLLIRHGLPERAESADGAPADPPLTPEGNEQAERLARWLRRESLAAVYTSPLRRARETAAPLARATDLASRVEGDLREYDADAPVYVPLEQLRRHEPQRWRELVEAGFYPGGLAEEFRRTVVGRLDRLIAAHPGATIAVVCHGGVINAWTSHVLGLERVFLFEPAYTSVSRFRAARTGERSLVSLNETAHLVP